MTATADSPARSLHPGLLFLLACLPWLPLPYTPFCYWQSDDFIALHHVQDFGRVLGDFVGPQYDMPALVLFYRPLITLSFWLDSLWGGLAPFVSHLENVLAHGLSCLLLAALLERLLPRTRARAAALCWAWMPGHAGSVLWAVGRVDSFTCVWILASTLFFLRHCEGRSRSRIPDLSCFGLALLCKELGMVVIGLHGLVALATGPRRIPQLLRRLLPGLLLLLAYLLIRRACLGVWLGGYEGQIDKGAALSGLGLWTARILNPLQQLPMPGLPMILWLGLIPACIGAWGLCRQIRPPLLLLLGLAFVGCAVPVFQLWPETGNPKNLRNFYLPAAALAVLLGAGRPGLTGTVLALSAASLLYGRWEYLAASRDVYANHQDVMQLPQATAVFSPLARENPSGLALRLDQGVDRLRRSPFSKEAGACYALRPLSHMPGRNQLLVDEGPPDDWGHILVRGRFVRRERPDLQLAWQGPAFLDRAVLDRMVQDFLAQRPPGPDTPAIRVLGQRAAQFRVSVFTAGGYITAFVPDRAPPESPDGLILIGDLLQAKTGSQGAAAQQAVALPLRVATAVDLEPRFPILVETVSEGDGQLRSTRANRQPVYLHLFRHFASWYKL